MTGDVFIRFEGLSKTFPGVKALENITLDIRTDEVLGLIGENGAGKSTLIKILSGVYTPDPGSRIEIMGKTVGAISTRESLRSGIVVIYQDFSLFPNLSVRENIAMSEHLERGRRLVNWKQMDAIAKRALEELGVSIDLGTKLGQLSSAKQQLVAIARALVYDAKLIVMDEPTSSLSKGEVDVLFGIIRKLHARNIGVVYVSHKLEELFEVCDRMTVLRDGKCVGSYPTSEMTYQRLISLMVGREVTFESLLAQKIGREVLSVRSISRFGNFEDISFSLRAGEIVGITGLVGAGRTEMVRALFGLNRPDRGEIWLDGGRIMPRSPEEAKNLGIAYVPEGRQTEGLILRQDVTGNITLSILGKFVGRSRLVNFRERLKTSREWIGRLRVRPEYPNMLTSKLSGGNQQKVVVAKWLATNPKVLIIDEPTNGIDVGAKSEIHQLLRKLADGGMGILMVSSELAEVLAISDRILVMRQGRLVAEFANRDATQEAIMNCAVPKTGKAAVGGDAS